MSIATHDTTPGVFDVAVIGAGGAGLTLLHALALRCEAPPTALGRPLRVLVSDDINRLAQPRPDRTWCFWGQGRNIAEDAVCKQWQRLRIAMPGRDRIVAPRRHRYSMIRSGDYHALVAKAVAGAQGLEVTWVGAASAVDADGSTVAVTEGSRRHRAHWAVDSRPRDVAGARTTLWQSFSGVFVRAHEDVFRPETATFMDFRVPQPDGAVAFGYILPINERTALVEYTEFGPTVPGESARREALDQYLATMLHCRRYVELATEHGVIGMHDAPPAELTGRILPGGAVGGATRPSTGYAFTAMQRGAAHVAEQLVSAQNVTAPAYYPSRHRLMDGVLLRGLAIGAIDGPTMFDRLFSKNDPDTVLRYLGGFTRITEDVSVMGTAPWGPMLRATTSRLWRPLGVT